MLTATIYHDSDCESPREHDNLGTMALFARTLKVVNESKMDMHELQVYLNSEFFHGVCVNVFAYIHSGITLNTHGFNCPWDSGQLGVCYVDKETMEKAFPDAGEDERIVRTFDCLISEVEEYSKWLNGECYGYIIRDESGNEVDSCWGFIGLDWAETAAKNAGAERVIHSQA